MHKLYLISFLLLLVNYGFAQNDTLQLPTGEWYYYEATKPDVNDHFRLSREKTFDSYVKWEFRENGSFTEQEISESSQVGNSGESVMILSSYAVSNWIYDKERKTVELRDISRIYKVTEIDEKFLELLRLE